MATVYLASRLCTETPYVQNTLMCGLGAYVFDALMYRAAYVLWRLCRDAAYVLARLYSGRLYSGR